MSEPDWTSDHITTYSSIPKQPMSHLGSSEILHKLEHLSCNDQYVLKEEFRDSLDSLPTASTLHRQEVTVPFNTIIVRYGSFEAFKVVAFDPTECDGPYYGNVPIISNGDYPSEYI